MRLSGSMSGMWKRSMVWLVRHRQPKGPETDRPHLTHRATSRLHRRLKSFVLQGIEAESIAALRGKARKPGTGQFLLEFAKNDSEDGGFWQRRFYDFNVWSAKKVKEKLDYVHANPVKRKLVEHAKDWPWSSWSHYAKGEARLLRIDNIASEETGQQVLRVKSRKSQEPHP